MLALVSFVGGATTGWPLLQHVAFSLVALVALCYLLLRTSERGLRMTVRVSRSRLVAGDEIEAAYIFTNESMWPALWVEVIESDAAGTPRERPSPVSEPLQATVPGRSERIVRRTRTFPYRGRYRLGADSVRVRDPLGLFSRVCRISEQVDIVVYPRPIAIPDALQATREVSAGRRHRHLTEADATRGDLREYVPGDSPSRIHWRTSARRGTLMIAEPESLQQRNIWLVVDFGGSAAAADVVAGVAAHIANSLFRSGLSVGAVVAGMEIALIPASRDRGQLGRILETLAGAAIAPMGSLGHAVEMAAECERPECFLVISASPSANATAMRLRPLCSRVRVIPVTTGIAEVPA